MHWLVSAVLVLVVAYFGLALFALFFSNGIIFPRPRPTYQDAPGQNKLPAPDGNEITAIFLPNPDAPFTLLYSPGNAEDLGQAEDLLREFQFRGWAVFAYDYPGYGTSTGTPSEASAGAAIAAAYAFLTTIKNIAPQKIVLYGRSVGAGPSLELASQVPVGGVIVEGAFVSAFRVLTRWRLLPWDNFDNLSKIRHLHVPLLSIHAGQDRTVPFRQGESLYHAHPGPKQKLWVAHAGHNNIIEADPAAYWDAIEQFRQSLLKTPLAQPAARAN